MAPDSSCSAMSRRVMRNPLIMKKMVTPTGPQTSTTPAPNRRWRPTFNSFSAWPRTTIAAEIPRSPSSDGSHSGNDRASRVACASKTPPRTKLRTFYRERTDPIVRTGRSLARMPAGKSTEPRPSRAAITPGRRPQPAPHAVPAVRSGAPPRPQGDRSRPQRPRPAYRS